LMMRNDASDGRRVRLRAPHRIRAMTLAPELRRPSARRMARDPVRRLSLRAVAALTSERGFIDAIAHRWRRPHAARCPDPCEGGANDDRRVRHDVL
jgi:hypothetical protein